MTGINGNNKFQQLSNDSIILVDSLSSVDKVSKIIHKFPSILIISFDYDVHNKLNNLGIKHSISEDYANNFFNQTQAKIYDFSNWYKDPKISSFLDYSNLNYGQLFHEEIIDLLVSFLKKFQEIKSIQDRFPHAHFLANSILYDILSSFTSSITKLSSLDYPIVFANEKIRYNIKIGNKHLMLFISRKMYLRLKRFSEFFIHILFNPSSYKNSKCSLMVEFDTERYHDIFSASSLSNSKILFYGRRRPAIWNSFSFNIFKKTKSKVITSYFLSDSHINKEIDLSTSELNSQLDKMFQNSLFFKNFFTIDGLSFWSSLKPTFKQLLKSRVADTIFEIKLAKNLFQKCNISNVMVLSEIGFTEQIVISQAKLHEIPVILLQMGLNFDTKEAYMMNYSQSVYPINADKFAVWGKIYAEDAKINGNIDDSKILSIGSPRFDSLIFNNKETSDDFVLLATSGPQREDLNGISVPNIEKYKDSIKQICQIVKSQNKKLIIKLHPSWAELDITDIAKNIDPSIEIITSGKISTLIKSCKLMICMGLSTAILEAQILQKPVVSIPVIEYNWGNPTIFSSNACLISTVDDLPKILQELDNDKFKNNVVENANKFLKNCLINHNSASVKLMKYLDTL